MAKNVRQTRAVLFFKERGNDIIVNYDIASSHEERQKIAKTIYAVLAIYGLDFVVMDLNRGNFVISDLKTVDYYDNVLSDIKDYYLEEYSSSLLSE